MSEHVEFICADYSSKGQIFKQLTWNQSAAPEVQV